MTNKKQKQEGKINAVKQVKKQKQAEEDKKLMQSYDDCAKQETAAYVRLLKAEKEKAVQDAELQRVIKRKTVAWHAMPTRCQKQYLPSTSWLQWKCQPSTS